MRLTRWTRISLLVALPLVMFGAVACDDDNDVTGSGGALASLNLDVPETVNSGVAFDVVLTATAIGVENVQNGVVTVTLAGSDSGDRGRRGSGHVRDLQRTGAVISWTLNTLDSNTDSVLTIHSMARAARREAQSEPDDSGLDDGGRDFQRGARRERELHPARSNATGWTLGFRGSAPFHFSARGPSRFSGSPTGAWMWIVPREPPSSRRLRPDADRRPVRQVPRGPRIGRPTRLQPSRIGAGAEVRTDATEQRRIRARSSRLVRAGVFVATCAASAIVASSTVVLPSFRASRDWPASQKGNRKFHAGGMPILRQRTVL